VLVLDQPLKLSVAKRRSVVGVMLKVAKGGEEDVFLDFVLVEVLLLEHLLVKPPLGLMLIGGVLMLSLALTSVVVTLVDLQLALHIGVVGDKLVGVSIVEAAILGPAITLVHVVVVELCEASGNTCQLLIPKALNLLL
jgi:hypothetical protein